VIEINIITLLPNPRVALHEVLGEGDGLGLGIGIGNVRGEPD
jgi:hypothetical protein